MSNLIIIALTERKLKLFFKVTWSWFVTSTYLISLIGCTFLPNFVAIVVVETEMSTLIWVITWIPRKKLNPPRWEILKIRNTNLQFISPGKVSTRKDKKNIANCKALCVLHKTQKAIAKRYALWTNAIKNKNESFYWNLCDTVWIRNNCILLSHFWC